MEKQRNDGFYSKLVYNEKQKQLELSGYPLLQGERIEIKVLNNWLAGSVQQDRGGGTSPLMILSIFVFAPD